MMRHLLLWPLLRSSLSLTAKTLKFWVDPHRVFQGSTSQTATPVWGRLVDGQVMLTQCLGSAWRGGKFQAVRVSNPRVTRFAPQN